MFFSPPAKGLRHQPRHCAWRPGHCEGADGSSGPGSPGSAVSEQGGPAVRGAACARRRRGARHPRLVQVLWNGKKKVCPFHADVVREQVGFGEPGAPKPRPLYWAARAFAENMTLHPSGSCRNLKWRCSRAASCCRCRKTKPKTPKRNPESGRPDSSVRLRGF